MRHAAVFARVFFSWVRDESYLHRLEISQAGRGAVKRGSGMKLTLERLAGDDLPLLCEFTAALPQQKQNSRFIRSRPRDTGMVKRATGNPCQGAQTCDLTPRRTEHHPGTGERSSTLPSGLHDLVRTEFTPDRMRAALSQAVDAPSDGAALSMVLDAAGLEIWDGLASAPSGKVLSIAEIYYGLRRLVRRSGAAIEVDLCEVRAADVIFLACRNRLIATIAVEGWSVFETPTRTPLVHRPGQKRPHHLEKRFQSALVGAFRLIP